MDQRFGDWLAGFIDGEGCFLITAKEDRVRIWFVLAVRADDRYVLDEIVAKTGIGRVRSHFKGDATRSPQVRWELSSRDDARALVALLDEHPLRAKKRTDFAVWREAVLAREALGLPVTGRPAFAVDWSPFKRLMNQLKLGRAYVEAK